MNQAQALEKAKGFLMEEVESITEPSKRAGKNMYICPLCGSGTGANASGAFSIDKDTNFTTWHCFACGKGGDKFDLAREYKKILYYPKGNEIWFSLQMAEIKKFYVSC